MNKPITEKHRIRFSVDEAEYQELKLRAERKFCSVSIYVKQAVWSEIRRHSPSVRKINKFLETLLKRKPGDDLLAMMVRDKPSEGFIYFFQEIGTEFVKIGWSRDPSMRLKGISTDNPHEVEVLAVIPGSRELESQLQGYLGASVHRGEWFLLTEQVYQVIATAKSVGDSLLYAGKALEGVEEIKIDVSHVGQEDNPACGADGEGVRD